MIVKAMPFVAVFIIKATCGFMVYSGDILSRIYFLFRAPVNLATPLDKRLGWGNQMCLLWVVSSSTV
ncbi:hypothetical protein Avbf_06067 [Armadillidium vulgare]|nr:hypothetical protein Avbf_06067 [Armadillidium vulgare]